MRRKVILSEDAQKFVKANHRRMTAFEMAEKRGYCPGVIIRYMKDNKLSRVIRAKNLNNKDTTPVKEGFFDINSREYRV